MSLSYFNLKSRRKSKAPEPTTEEAVSQAVDTAVGKETAPPAPAVSTPSGEPGASPVLDEEDEKFLARLAALSQEPEGTPPPLPTRPSQAAVTTVEEKKAGKDAQEALMDGAHQVPLPMSPAEPTTDTKEKGKERPEGLGRKKSVMSYFSLAQARFKKTTADKKNDSSKDKDSSSSKERRKSITITAKDKQKAADTLLSAAQTSKAAQEKEKAKEEQDITAILDELNLSAVNNRVFSFSAESEALFAKFTLVLKDIVNGAPTAYNDLEKLFTDYETTLKNMYGNLPPFLQSMVKSLPAKMTAALGPEILAAASEKPGFDAKNSATWKEGAKGYAKGYAKKKAGKAGIPSLRSLLSKEGAVAAMLRSILNFLKLRFPAVMTGTNVVMSLAVCLLLFVFWYCHKRGRETRLEAEAESSRLASPNNGSTSSLASEPDSIFASRHQAQHTTATQAADDEKPSPPLVISDERGTQRLAETDVQERELPSVRDLPSPGVVPAAVGK